MLLARISSLAVAFVVALAFAACGGGISGTPPLLPTPPSCLSSNTCSQQSFVFASSASQTLVFPAGQNGGLGAPASLPGPLVPGGIAVSPVSGELFIVDHAGGELLAFVQGTGGYSPAPGSPYSLGLSAGLLESVVVTKDGRFAYVIGLSGGIFGFSIGTNGAISAVPGSPFPVAAMAVSSATDASSKFLFVVSGTTISSFVIDSTTGALTANATPIGDSGLGLLVPDTAATAPAGNFLYVALSGSNSVAAFSFDSTGALTEISGSPFATGALPIGVAVTSSSVYVANSLDQTISAFEWNNSTGALTEVSGSPFSAPWGSSSFGVLSNQYLYIPSVNNVFSPNVNAILGFSIGPSGTLTPLSGSPFNSSVALSGSIAAF